MAYKQFSYSGSNYYGNYTAYARVYYSEDEYDASHNRTKVSLSKVDFYVSNSFSACPCYGTVSFGGTTVKTFSGGYTNTASGGSWNTITGSSGDSSVWITHNKPSGTATMSISIDIYVDVVSGRKFYVDDSGSVNLTTRTSTLTVNPNDGTWNGSSSAQSFNQAPTSTKTIAAPSRTGYTFDGWTKSGGGSWNGTTYTFGSSNGTLTANWQINTWTVDYDANGGSGAPASQTKTYGQTLVLASDVPTRTGYAFKGWATTPDASAAQYQPGGNYTANEAATLYAVWEVLSYTLSITQSDRGVTTNALRTASPIGGAPSGLLNDGDTIYYGDSIKFSWSVDGAYQIETFTIDSEDVSALTEKTIAVYGDVSAVFVVEMGAIVYIHNEMYQAFIWNGAEWEQYEAYIYNGNSWDAY